MGKGELNNINISVPMKIISKPSLHCSKSKIIHLIVKICNTGPCVTARFKDKVVEVEDFFPLACLYFFLYSYKNTYL